MKFSSSALCLLAVFASPALAKTEDDNEAKTEENERRELGRTPLVPNTGHGTGQYYNPRPGRVRANPRSHSPPTSHSSPEKDERWFFPPPQTNTVNSNNPFGSSGNSNLPIQYEQPSASNGWTHQNYNPNYNTNHYINGQYQGGSSTPFGSGGPRSAAPNKKDERLFYPPATNTVNSNNQGTGTHTINSNNQWQDNNVWTDNNYFSSGHLNTNDRPSASNGWTHQNYNPNYNTNHYINGQYQGGSSTPFGSGGPRSAAPKKKSHTRSYDTLIVGGQDATIGEYPYYVQWLIGCGGSLIAPDLVLTAAHCNGFGLDDVIVGGYVSGETDHGAVRVGVLQAVDHPDYNDGTSEWDFALLKLDSQVNNELAILNFDGNKPQDGQTLTVIGLGATSEGGSAAEELLEVEVDYITTPVCDAMYGGGIFDDSMFCAGVPGGGKDSCQGDSGGPIVIQQDGQDVQVGVVSWGIGCAQAGYPGVYSRISGAEEWIKATGCSLTDTNPSWCAGVAPTPTPPSGPTPTPPVGGGGSCWDTPGWHDSYGSEYTCDWYSQDNAYCDDYGDDFENFGETANEACCTCGGGCSDTPGWHDSDGEEFDCAWYSEGDNCAVHGNDFENFGETANEACCACRVSTPVQVSCVNLYLKFNADWYAWENDFYLAELPSETLIWNEYEFSSWEETELETCINPNGCYVFDFYDSEADGLGWFGNLYLEYDGQMVYDGRNFDEGVIEYFGNGC